MWCRPFTRSMTLQCDGSIVAPSRRDGLAFCFEGGDPLVDVRRRRAAIGRRGPRVEVRRSEKILQLFIAELQRHVCEKRTAGLADARLIEVAGRGSRDVANAPESAVHTGVRD